MAPPLFERRVVAAVPEDPSGSLVIPHHDAGDDETRQHQVAVAVDVIPLWGAWASEVHLEPEVVTQ